MFRNFISVLLILAVILPSSNTDAGRKRSAKSGKIKSNVFTDSKYKFNVSIPDGWKAKTKKEKSDCRLTVIYEKGEKGDLRTNALGVDGFELSIPYITFWIIKTEISSKEYLDDFLKAPLTTSVNEKIIASMQASWAEMHFDEFKTWRYSAINVDNQRGVNWVGLLNCKYKSSNVTLRYQLYTIFDCVQMDDNTLLMIAGRTEPENFNEISGQMQYIMRSVTWGKD